VKGQRGFTLIEVIVAAAIFGIAAGSLFALLSRSLANIRKIEDVHHYQLASEDVMNRALALRTLPANVPIEGALKNPPGRWIVRVSPWSPSKFDSHPSEAIVKIDVEVRWQGRSGERSVKLEALKAVNLSYGKDDFAEAIAHVLPE
jgi:prepilin-type N-terminal cleavage/methylation domain-containing protein